MGKYIFLLSFAFLLSFLVCPSFPQVNPAIPAEFSLIQTVTGIKLYRNPKGDFIQVIDLSQGASIELLLGEPVGEGEAAAYGGENPLFQRQTLQQFWLEFSQTFGEKAFSVYNGHPFTALKRRCLRMTRFPSQFFNLKNPSALAFPVQVKGKLITTGYAGNTEFPGEKVVLGVSENRADILPFSEDSNFQKDSFPFDHAIVGIREDGGTKTVEWYSKEPLKERPRTFMGVANFSHIFILTSPGKTQGDAAKILKAFGAEKVMMLDGGGSTQLIIKGIDFVSSSDPTPRTIPQAIGVFEGQKKGE
ncbi:MAG: phosphodiester glycosidase family protein [Limnoraphis sp. WC205]|nr:phosphodiester glycosidase family protein [Limnoraphis sp. WC205]